MKKTTRKIALIVCILTLISTALISCNYSTAELRVKLRDNHWWSMDTTFIFDESWIFGKNSDEIQAKYGKFDQIGKLNEQGLCYDSCCSYSTQYFPGIGLKESYVIYFDSDGIAYKIIKRDTPKGG